MITHLYSDPHYGHTNIIKYCNRPFNSAQHMEAEMIRRYNEVVGEGDTVLWCGDAFFGRECKDPSDVLRRLNGHKILVKGNHDKSPAVMAQMGFAMVLTECTLHIAGRTCRVSHFPYEGIEHSREGGDSHRKDKFKALRPKRVKGEVLIHGHTHSNKKRQGNCIHVGVDAWDYRPAPMKAVAALVAQV